MFFALREEDPDDVAARSEPVLLLVWLAGMAAVLATPTAGALLDKPEYDALLVAVWAFVAGGIYGAVGYFLFGFALFFGARLLGSLGSFRRERHVVGFALAPLALSLLVLLPVRLLLYGGDTFRETGADEGSGETALLAAQLVFVGWSAALLVLGVKVVHGWGWLRSLGAIAGRRRAARRDRRRVRDALAAYSQLSASRLDATACSKTSSSSAGMAYVCASSGKRRSRTSDAKDWSADRIVSPISA